MKRKKEGKRSFHQLCAIGALWQHAHKLLPRLSPHRRSILPWLSSPTFPMESEVAAASLMILSGKLATPPPAPSAEKKETEESEKDAIFAHERHGGAGGERWSR